MANKAISLEQFKAALKAIRNSTISEPDLSVRFAENAPDWNALEGEAGYIQGRTHWSEMSIVDIFKDLEVSELEEGAGLGILQGAYDIEAGKQYIVTYNGTEFSCTSAYYEEEGVNTAVVIGNVDALKGTGDSGEPFLLMFVLPEFIEAIGAASMIMFLDGSSSAVISLSGETEIVHKLPQKYYDSADWDAAQGESGYMKNKLLGEEAEIIQPETEKAFDVVGDKMIFTGVLSSPLINGESYRISINGEVYRAKAILTSDQTAFLGNPSLLTLPTDNGLPFVLSANQVSLEYSFTLIAEKIIDRGTIKIEKIKMIRLPNEYSPRLFIFDATSLKDADNNDISLETSGRCNASLTRTHDLNVLRELYEATLRGQLCMALTLGNSVKYLFFRIFELRVALESVEDISNPFDDIIDITMKCVIDGTYGKEIITAKFELNGDDNDEYVRMLKLTSELVE